MNKGKKQIAKLLKIQGYAGKFRMLIQSDFPVGVCP